jgi:methylated-DNA-[protein]-cysteine S-methyltransferase
VASGPELIIIPCTVMRSSMSLDEAFTSSSPMRTERLCLRRLELDDAGSVFAFKSEPEASRLHGEKPHRDINESKEWVRQYLADNELRKAITWVIVERENDEVIGECCLWNIDHEQGCAELGYELRSSHWGKGLMKEALGPVLDFGFQALGLHRVQAFTLETNGPSRKVLTDIHFKHEGTLRLKVPIGKMFVDELVYGLLREEWEEAFLAREEGIKRVSFFDTDLGRMGVAEHAGMITDVHLPGELPKGPFAEIGTPLLEEAARQIKEYLNGERKGFDLPLSNEGTDFSTLVWEALRRIPYGETCSYGKIASAIGRPGAARAVGRSCNRNPLPILVPCHRVVGADGRLTGYAGGLQMKRALLDMERDHALL